MESILKIKTSQQKYQEKNKELLKLKSIIRYKNNKEKENERTRKWYNDNKDGYLKKYYKNYNSSENRKESLKKYQKDNKKEIKERSDKWYIDNVDRISKRNKLHHINKRLEIIYYYTNGSMKCNKCGEHYYEFLEIDHINGGGHQHILRIKSKLVDDIIRNNFPEGYQILCSNCNIKKLKELYRLKEDRWKFQKAYNQRLKIKVLKHYSSELKCDCCNEGDIDVLTIDHINGGGRKHRKEVNGNIYKWIIDNNFPEDYRVLCQNCNQSYGHHEYCPHQIK